MARMPLATVVFTLINLIRFIYEAVKRLQFHIIVPDIRRFWTGTQIFCQTLGNQFEKTYLLNTAVRSTTEVKMAVARTVLKKKFGCNQCCLAQKRQQVVPFFDNNQVQYPGGRTQPEHIRRACACASERAARAARHQDASVQVVIDCILSDIMFKVIFFSDLKNIRQQKCVQKIQSN